jgi:hypothetical protein
MLSHGTTKMQLFSSLTKESVLRRANIPALLNGKFEQYARNARETETDFHKNITDHGYM